MIHGPLLLPQEDGRMRRPTLRLAVPPRLSSLPSCPPSRPPYPPLASLPLRLDTTEPHDISHLLRYREQPRKKKLLDETEEDVKTPSRSRLEAHRVHLDLRRVRIRIDWVSTSVRMGYRRLGRPGGSFGNHQPDTPVQRR